MAVNGDPDIAREPAAPHERGGSRLLVPGVDRALELVAVFTIITSLVGLSAALVGVFHAPQVLLGSLLLSGWYAYRTQGRGAFPGVPPRWWHIVLLLAVGLFFRVPAYHYVMGAQDEGLYTNIAQHIIHTGHIDAKDKVMRELQGSPYLQKYLQDNRILEGDSPTLYLSGVYAREPPSNHLVFQFYYLFPVWMAVIGGIFGAVNAEYALTFLALLTIFFFYRLALLLTRSPRAALTAGGLLALNPLHAFFSKFPVTEMSMLAFSLIGFTMLAAYWSAETGQRPRHWLTLSVLAFLCLFTAHISGFMYMPFFIALAIATLACDAELQRRQDIQRWALGVTIAYGISVFYGLRWSHFYSRDTYFTSFEPLFGAHWKLAVESIAVAGLLLWAAAGIWTRRPDRRAWISHRIVYPVNLLLGLIVLAALSLGLLKIYWLGWTDHYAATDLGRRWHLSGAGWHAASASSLSTLFVYLGPFLMLAFFYLVGRRQSDARLGFLRFFLVGFFVYAMLLVWVIPYAAYYARYLFSEVVPYLILFVVCAWSMLRPGGARAALSAGLFLSLVYGGVIAAAQIGKNEDEGAHESLARLVAPVEANDLILLDTLHRQPDTSIIKTPLVYTFDRNVVTVGDDSLSDTGYLAKLNSIYDDLFLVSSSAVAPRGFALLDGVRFKVMTFEHTHFFPRRLVPAQDIVLYLYRLDKPQFPLRSVERFGPTSPWTDWLRKGWSDPEPWGVWSEGNQAQLDIDTRELPDVKGLVLQIDANAFVSPAHAQQRVAVSINGQPIAQYSVIYPTTTLTMRIPVAQDLIESGQRMVIDFALPDAISPAALRVGGDTRQLAIGLESASMSVALQSHLQSAPAKTSATTRQGDARR